MDEQVPDSAGTATAYVGGAKTNAGVIGYDENVQRGDCATTTEEKKVSAQYALFISNVYLCLSMNLDWGRKRLIELPTYALLSKPVTMHNC